MINLLLDNGAPLGTLVRFCTNLHSAPEQPFLTRDALGVAIYQGYTDTVKALLGRGAMVPDILKTNSLTPGKVRDTSIGMFFACRYTLTDDHVRVLHALIAHGATPPKVFTLAEYRAAIRGGSVRMIEWLAQHDAKDSTLQEHSSELLTLASCSDNRIAITEWLLQHGADINAKDEHGSTALHSAVRHISMSNIQRLVENGANILTPDHRGETVLDSSTVARVRKLQMTFGRRPSE